VGTPRFFHGHVALVTRSGKTSGHRGLFVLARFSPSLSARGPSGRQAQGPGRGKAVALIEAAGGGGRPFSSATE